MSKSMREQDSTKQFEFSALFPKSAPSERDRVRLFFHKWVKRLNNGSTKVTWGGFEVADLYVEFETQLRSLSDETLKEMVEDAHKL